MDWKTRDRVESFGDLDLSVRALESLEKTIDELFVELSRTGNPKLLEELCPYFGCVWPSARALASFLALAPLESEGARNFLEVGCGLALPSIVLLRKTRLSMVTASDFHPEVPKFLEENLALNFSAEDEALRRFRYLELDWRNPPPSELQRYHWVVGSDVLYEKDHAEDVAEALTRLVKSKGRITVADPGRPYLQKFIDEMKARGWMADPVVTSAPDPEGEGMKEVFLLDFRPIRRNF